MTGRLAFCVARQQNISPNNVAGKCVSFLVMCKSVFKSHPNPFGYKTRIKIYPEGAG